MNEEINAEEIKYFFLPTQIIDFEGYVILRKGIVHLKVSGEDAMEIIKVIMIHLTSEGGASVNDIINYFDGSYKDSIELVVSQLIQKRFLVRKKEGAAIGSENTEKELVNFYWTMNLKEEQIEKLKNLRIHLLGVNHISVQMCELLKKSGFENYTLIDYPLLRNVYYFDNNGLDCSKVNTTVQNIISYNKWLDQLEYEEFDMLVCTSDFGGTYYMRDFNKICVENEVPFFAVALQNLRAYVGPMVIPGYTACYECFLQRQNSNQEGFEMLRTIELSDYEGQEVNAFHPSMSFAAADVAVMEIFKFYTGVTPVQNTGRIIEINLLNTEMKNKLVLKIPRCTVCSKVHKISATAIYDDAFMPTHSE